MGDSNEWKSTILCIWNFAPAASKTMSCFNCCNCIQTRIYKTITGHLASTWTICSIQTREVAAAARMRCARTSSTARNFSKLCKLCPFTKIYKQKTTYFRCCQRCCGERRSPAVVSRNNTKGIAWSTCRQITENKNRLKIDTNCANLPSYTNSAGFGDDSWGV